eukprot:PLAT4266.1.p2 GENE.PLAT4266.1~~PLAT4266.1.p2  ORF type:complete len:170 (-),score=53.16 PLAT4266.1:51-560(-)
MVRKFKGAYFWFLEEARPAMREKNPGLSGPELTKLLGAAWRALSKEEKQRYCDLATQDKARFEREQAERDIALLAMKPEGGAEEVSFTLPIGRVGRIMKHDSDVKMIGRDARVVVVRAAELFLESLGQAAADVTQKDGRKMCRLRDLARAVRSKAHDRLHFLADEFPLD